ncbi:MAG: YceI family protein [Desulfobulbaceae bacterium]
MRKLQILSLFFCLLLVTQAWGARYDIDPDHTEIGFSVRHMVITNVRGAFRKFSATFMVSDANILESLAAEIDVASIDTRIQKRDDHLRSADFFDAAAHPVMTFATTGVEPLPDGRYKVKGILTIRGTSREIELDGELAGPVTDPWGNRRMGVVLRGRIDRRDFGVAYNKVLETGGLLIDNEVAIHLEGEGILKK